MVDLIIPGRVTTSSHIGIQLAWLVACDQGIFIGRWNRIGNLDLVRKSVKCLIDVSKELSGSNHCRIIPPLADLPTRIDLLGAALPAGTPLAVHLALHPVPCCGGAVGGQEGVLEGGHCWLYQEWDQEAKGGSAVIRRGVNIRYVKETRKVVIWLGYLNIATSAHAKVV